MEDKQSIRDKVVIEKLLSIIAENKSKIVDDFLIKRSSKLIQDFVTEKVSLKNFIDKSVVYGLITPLHWNYDTFPSCENRFFTDLKMLGISIPSELKTMEESEK